MSATGVETVDNYTVVLHLDQAKLDVAETLSLYQAMMVHHNFGGDITNTKEPSLMYMVLKEYLPGERAVLTRRTDYWENGLDGQPLPYLDGITYIDMGGINQPDRGVIERRYCFHLLANGRDVPRLEEQFESKSQSPANRNG